MVWHPYLTLSHRLGFCLLVLILAFGLTLDSPLHASPLPQAAQANLTACQTDVKGFVFEDANGDGKKDPSEVGVFAVKVKVKDPATGKILQRAQTNATGRYQLKNLGAGKRKVSIKIPLGYTRTTPKSKTVTLPPCRKVNFGIRKPTATPTATSTASDTSTPTRTGTPTLTPTQTQTRTSTWTATRTRTRTATRTATQTRTSTLTPTTTNTRTLTPTATPTDPPVPPDPASIAPPVDMSVATDLGSATEFLYTGNNPIQTGVNAGTIDPLRVSVLRGKVQSNSGAPLAAVVITILDQPEFGQTLTRTDGMFDLAVNGGGLLTVNYAKEGYLSAQRQVDAPWQDYAWLPDVMLLRQDPNLTLIDLSANTPIQVARGSVLTDSDGTRQETLFFPQGTLAQLAFANGSTQPITQLHVRITEYTVGPNGQKAMPAELPANSAYTYATEVNADEATAAGAETVEFNPPILSYNENFLNLPVGIPIPMGAYDPARGAWIAGDSGLVVKILSITAGKADLDIDGSGVAASASALAARGITDAERAKLAQLYTVGQSLWRVPLPHFSGWDKNLGTSCKEPCPTPAPPRPKTPTPTPDNPKKRCGSIIGCENQTLGQVVGILGTAFKLYYQSDRVPGRREDYTRTFQVTDNDLGTMEWARIEVRVAGRLWSKEWRPAEPNLEYTFTWDGKDGYGRFLQGPQPLDVRLSYAFPLRYQTTDRFGYKPTNPPLYISTTRTEFIIASRWVGTIGQWQTLPEGIGGWTLDVQHRYDPKAKVLYMGDGTRRSSESLNFPIVQTVAGNGLGVPGDNVPAINTKLAPRALAVSPDGSYYIATGTGFSLISRVDPDGMLHRIAGDPTKLCNYAPDPCGDGGQAINATFRFVVGLAVAPDHSLYITDGTVNRVRRISPDGIITNVAGSGEYCPNVNSCFSGDGGDATQAKLNAPSSVDLAPDGSIYISDNGNHRIRRVDTSGRIDTVAGGGTSGAEGVPATQANLFNLFRSAVGPDGDLYIALQNKIRRVGRDGLIRTVAGTGTNGYSGDGGPALNAQFNSPEGLVIAPDGGYYFAQDTPRVVRYVNPEGIINTVAGTGTAGFSGDGGPALRANFALLYAGDAVALAPNGNLYIADYGNGRIRLLSSALPDPAVSDAIPDEAGDVVYLFNGGRHLSTVNALTGTALYQFEYDGAGRLSKITDGDGNLTEIKRDANGKPKQIIAPFGQVTTFTVDAFGYLKTITNPANEQVQFTYDADGLMTSMTDARNLTHTFHYDPDGRLTRDDDPASGNTTLSRTDEKDAYTVTVMTALSRVTTYRLEELPTGGFRQVNTYPNGLQDETVRKSDGTSSYRATDGTTQDVILGPDPRWKMLAPVSSATTRTPGGLTLTTQETRTVSLANPSNPFSLNSLTEVISINGRQYTSTYTGSTRTWVEHSPEGRTVTTQIDAQGRILFEQATGLAPLSYEYDPHGRLKTAKLGTDPNARTATFTYNTAGYLATVTDPLNRTVSFTYDLAGRVLTQTLPGNRVITYTYDANSNLKSLTPPGKTAHTFDYTAIDLLSKYTPPDVNAGVDDTQYDYDTDRQLTTITRPDSKKIGVGYDSAGRLDTLTIARGVLDYGYNATTGNLESVNAPDGINLNYSYDGGLLKIQTWSGAVTGAVSRAYDNNFRVTTLGLNGNDVPMSYDNDSLLKQVGDLTLTRDAQNGLLKQTALGAISDTLSYNGFGEPDTYTANKSGTELFKQEFTYDSLGRIVTKTETISGTSTLYEYSYHNEGWLKEVKKDGVVVSSYTYDSNGNRSGGTYDAQDRMTSFGANTYTYTANGELKTKTSGGQTTQYNYDEPGNLTQVILPNGKQIDYLVDGQNRRVGKKENGVLTNRFLYESQLRPIAELDGTGNLVSRFIYATRVNVPDYMVKNGVTYRFILDHLGSPRYIVNAADGSIAQEMDYDAWGRVIKDTAQGFQPFGFAGGLYDPETGLVRFGVRDYDAETGRWTVKDLIGFYRGTNMFAYVRDDPINRNDPSGFVDVFVWGSTGPHTPIVGPAGEAVAIGGYSSKDGFYTADIFATRGIRVGGEADYGAIYGGKEFVSNGDIETIILAEGGFGAEGLYAGAGLCAGSYEVGPDPGGRFHKGVFFGIGGGPIGEHSAVGVGFGLPSIDDIADATSWVLDKILSPWGTVSAIQGRTQ